MSETDPSPPKDPFPWDIGIFDAHCHPTDSMSSINLISGMKARALTVMSTRSQDQDLVDSIVSKDGGYSCPSDDPEPTTTTTHNKIIPSFGWHPWFSHQLYDDTADDVASLAAKPPPPTKTAHYTGILTPAPTADADADADFISSLPAPLSLSTFLSQTSHRLLSHPSALIGEIGLDRSFRLPQPWTAEQRQHRDESYTDGTRQGRRLSPYRVSLAHQKAILKAQLRLAGRMQRPVSLHSVQAHGAVLEVLRELWRGWERPVMSKRERKKRKDAATVATITADGDGTEEGENNGGNTTTDPKEEEETAAEQPKPPFPPRLCLHSYSGPPDFLPQFLHLSVPCDIYFSFSCVINFSSSSPPSPSTSDSAKTSQQTKVEQVIRQLPEDRILIESDFHAAGEEMDGYLEEIGRRVCEIRGWGLREGCERLRANWRGFVFGRDS